MVDLINKVRAKAVRKPVDSKLKEDVVWYPDPSFEPLVLKLIELGHISKTIEPIFDQQKTVVYGKLFNMYTEKMWSGKSKPDNPRIVIKKKGQDTKDMACVFIVKFRSDGLKKFLPNPEDLQDQEPRDVLVQTLISQLVGLSKENALKITDPDNGEFIIKDNVNLVESFDAMYYGDNPVRKSAATKLLTYLSAAPNSKNTKLFHGEYLTDEEQAVLVTEQFLYLKDGFLERACSYCQSADQLHALLKFVKISFFCQNFEFAVGDEPTDRNARLENAVKEILLSE
jgi:hypothetical protein